MNSDAKKVLELLKQEEMIENSLANGYGQWTVIYDSYFKNGVSCRRYAILNWQMLILVFRKKIKKVRGFIADVKKNQYLSRSLPCKALVGLSQISGFYQKVFVF